MNGCAPKVSKIEQQNLLQSAREYPLAHAPSRIGKSEQIKHTSTKGINYQLKLDDEHGTKRKEREQTDTSPELRPKEEEADAPSRAEKKRDSGRQEPLGTTVGSHGQAQPGATGNHG
jgi:hypothetical protein